MIDELKMGLDRSSLLHSVMENADKIYEAASKGLNGVVSRWLNSIL